MDNKVQDDGLNNKLMRRRRNELLADLNLAPASADGGNFPPYDYNTNFATNYGVNYGRNYDPRSTRRDARSSRRDSQDSGKKESGCCVELIKTKPWYWYLIIVAATGGLIYHLFSIAEIYFEYLTVRTRSCFCVYG